MEKSVKFIGLVGFLIVKNAVKVNRDKCMNLLINP